MIWLIEFILMGPVTLAMAWWHSRLIKAGRPIRHGWWSALYIILVVGAIGLFWQSLPGWAPAGIFALACACGRLVVFNIALNRFRGLSWTYVSAGTTSIIDKISIRLFGSRVWIFEAVLAVIFVILQFFLT